MGRKSSTDRIVFTIPHRIVDNIREVVEETPSDKPFWATLAFELMIDGSEHERPCCGLPAVGAYKEYGAVNSKG